MSSFDLRYKTVIVLDAHGILYQVFHSMMTMSSPQGEPTGALFGFVRDVIGLLMKRNPDYIFCAFDMPGPTFRHQLAADYKANRSAMPDDLQLQIGYVHDFLDAMGIPAVGISGYEADDVLATFAVQTEKNGGECLLVTSDKDARQLITDHVSLYNLRKELVYRKEELWNDWGIRPDQVIDFQTMVGDSTDNIAGIPLIGPKTATALLQEYDTLENLYQNIDQLTGRKKNNIANSREITNLSRKLVQLKTDVPIDIDWEKGAVQGVDTERLTAVFRYFGFKSLFPKISELQQKYGNISRFSGTYVPSVPNGKTTKSSVEQKEEEKTAPSDLRSAPTLFDFYDQQEKEKSKQTDTDVFSPKNDTTSLLNDGYPLVLRFYQSLYGSGNTISKTPDDLRVLLNQPGKVPDLPRPVSLFGDSGQEHSEFTFRNYPDVPNYHCVDTDVKFQNFLTILEQQDFLSVDLETTDCMEIGRVRPRFARIVGISFCFDPENAWYLPIRGPLGSNLLDETETLSRLKPVLESVAIKKIGQNIKYDMIVLRNYDIHLNGLVFDTMVADYLLHTGQQNHNMDDMSETWLGHTTIPISDLIGTGKKQKSMDVIPTELVTRYAGEDALVPYLLYPILLTELQKSPGLLRLLTDLEIPMIQTLVEMEYTGIAVDAQRFQELALIFQEELDLLETQIRDEIKNADPDPVFAQNCNLNSTKQLQRILFDDLKLPVIRKTQTGRSTDYAVLEELATLHPLPEKLIRHRQLTKLKGTYIDPLPTMIHPDTGRIHASFNQVVTATGRLSSSDPNLQNIPVRGNEGKMIREGFVPDRKSGFDTILSCDYSQIELRILTHLSGDENLKAAFLNDEDIHTHVAGKIFGVSSEEVTSEMRRTAKTVNFGLVYGQSAFGLSKILGIPQSEAASYIKTFFQTYPGIQTFFDRVLTDCQRLGYVTTILGRKRRIEGVRGPRGGQQLNMPERTAINTVIQGSAADLMKWTMVRVYDRFYRREKIAPQKTQLLLQIHDELLFETSHKFLPELTQKVKEEMELGQPLSVPLKVDAEQGINWGVLK